MGLLTPDLPPYDAIAWSKLPFAERGRLACESWAIQGYGSPIGVYLVYALKVVGYIAGWMYFCRFTPGMGELATFSSWWLQPVAFCKAILWSLLFEIVGLGCGSGPLTGRYWPPIGGILYFLRRGTTKLPVFPGLPIIGGMRRSVLDVALYGITLGLLVRALVSPEIGSSQVAPVVVAVALLGVLDKTLFLAARGEHYWTTLVCVWLATDWVPGAKAVALALWFWAGVSKLNAHFPTVVCVMTSNSPLLRFEWLRRRMYRHYPDDLRPSHLAEHMAHAGAALEFAVPLVLAFSSGGPSLVLGIVLMLLLHGYITSNVPMGVPIEWNFMVVYGGFALFWAHPDASVLEVGPWPIALLLVVALVALPLLGNLRPHALSFLLSMRYYAGNWAYGIWLIRGEAYRKLARLTKSAPWVYDQLDRFYPRPVSVALVSKVMAFRLMHLHGRALPLLVAKAVDNYEDYEHIDGEIIAGLVLGWNFGDGHIHSEQLLTAVQAQCRFDPGEVRCIFVEAQPMASDKQRWRIHDAATGLLASGELSVREMQTRQPWSDRA